MEQDIKTADELESLFRSNIEGVSTLLRMRVFWMDEQAQLWEQVIINKPIGANADISVIESHIKNLYDSGKMQSYKEYHKDSPPRLSFTEYDGTSEAYNTVLPNVNAQFKGQILANELMTQHMDKFLGEIRKANTWLEPFKPIFYTLDRLNKQSVRKVIQDKIKMLEKAIKLIDKFGQNTAELVNESVLWDSELFSRIYGNNPNL